MLLGTDNDVSVGCSYVNGFIERGVEGILVIFVGVRGVDVLRVKCSLEMRI